jgi:RimJ/RimL family protein N-acetyltransferase
MLAVNSLNEPAIAAYRKIGFVDTGRRFEEEPAPKLIFAKPLV